MSSDDESRYEVHEILGHRKRGRIVEYLVRWQGFDEDEDSWEPARNLKHAQATVDAYLDREKMTVKKKSAKVMPSRGTTRTTKTTTVVTTKSTSSGAMSESSSPEASPRPSRRTMTRHFESLDSDNDEVDSMLTSTSFSSEFRPDTSQRNSSTTCRLGKVCDSWMSKENCQIMFVADCFLIIVLTFIYDNWLSLGNYLPF